MRSFRSECNNQMNHTRFHYSRGKSVKPTEPKVAAAESTVRLIRRPAASEAKQQCN